MTHATLTLHHIRDCNGRFTGTYALRRATRRPVQMTHPRRSYAGWALWIIGQAAVLALALSA